MSIVIKPYSKDLIEAVIDFNDRLKKGGSTFRLPKDHLVHHNLPQLRWTSL